MSVLSLDHLAVAGTNLAEASDCVEAALGVPLQNGGQHAHFGTHNRLLGLADGLYLEVIAIDPAARALPYPRWFDLDRFAGPARLTNWICRTEDLNAILTALPEAGSPVTLERGDLSWTMAVPRTGRLPHDNRFPALIQWQGPHPAPRLTDRGCALRRLVVSHPEADTLEKRLAPYLSEPRIVFETGMSALRAEIDTPHGMRILA